VNYPFFDGSAVSPPAAPLQLPDPAREKLKAPEGYLADPGLVAAANVALLLGQPLLLTGNPGTGKTLFASRLAWELGLGAPEEFNTKSTTTARDLFYLYDALGRFHAAQTGTGSQDNYDYLTFSALGRAILRSRRREELEELGVLRPGEPHDGPRRTVVLIDEIDKAPRDFPNDLLQEVDNLSFRVPELGNVRVPAAAGNRPILVLTSNSERNLPDAFLRRCIFYRIPDPSGKALEKIVRTRLEAFGDRPSRLLGDALKFFEGLQQPSADLRRVPSPAELMSWLQALMAAGTGIDEPLADSTSTRHTLSVLAKTDDDADRLRELLGQFAAG
jgi:MoxR-like ATPase